MKFGYQQPSHTFENGRSTFANLKQIAIECEEQGYDSFWIMDHLIQIGLVDKHDEPIMEPYTALAALGACTSKIRLGALCTCNNFRNPALLAKMGATLDHITNGRFWLGLGAGWFQEEAMMYGYEFGDDFTRLEMLEEALQIVLGSWTSGKITFTGKYYTVKEFEVEPKPIQKPHPPILVGGGGEKVTLKLAAKYADACNLFPKGEELRRKLDILKKHCEAVGRDYSTILKTKLASVMFGKDEQDALRKIEQFKPEGVSMEHYSSSFFLGSPRDVARQVEEARALGIEYIMINFRGRYNPSDKKIFSEEVTGTF